MNFSPVVRPKSPVLTPVMTICRDLPRLVDQFGDRHVAARTAGVVDRAIGAAVVAAVLHLQKGARAVAARKSREERRQRIGVAAVDLRPALARQCEDPAVQFALVVVAQHQVDPLDGRYLLRLELSVASRHGDDRLRIAAVELADQVAALLVGMLGHRTAVDDANVGFGIGRHAFETAALELPGQCRRLREVEFAAEGMKIDSARLHPNKVKGEK